MSSRNSVPILRVSRSRFGDGESPAVRGFLPSGDFYVGPLPTTRVGRTEVTLVALGDCSLDVWPLDGPALRFLPCYQACVAPQCGQWTDVPTLALNW
jgi:hypothetical protein